MRVLVAAVLTVVLGAALVAIGLGGLYGRDPSGTPVAAEPPASNPPQETPERPLRMLAMGDSITAACGDGTGGYCVELTRLLDKAGVRHEFVVRAVGGTICAYWSAQIDKVLAETDPDLLLLECGTNNDTSTQAALNSLATQWQTIVQATHVHRPANPVRIGISYLQYSDPQGKVGWLPGSEERVNNLLIQQSASYRQAGWIAGTADFRQIPGNSTYLSDGIHPNDAGNKAKARIWYDALRGNLGWPDSGEPPLCGMSGHGPHERQPAYLKCD